MPCQLATGRLSERRSVCFQAGNSNAGLSAIAFVDWHPEPSVRLPKYSFCSHSRELSWPEPDAEILCSPKITGKACTLPKRPIVLPQVRMLPALSCPFSTLQVPQSSSAWRPMRQRG
jgi:hypothetical protein